MGEKTIVIPDRKTRRRRLPPWARRWLPRAAVALVVLGALLAVASLVIGRYSRRLAEELVAKAMPEIEARTGLHVMIGSIKPGLMGASVLRDVVVQSAPDGTRETFLRVPEMEVLHKISLRERTLVLKGVRLEQPSIVVELYPDGRTNLPDLLSRLRAMPAEGSGPPRPSGILGRLLGGSSELNVVMDGGSLMLRDLGRFRAAEPIITAFHDIEGDLRFDLAARQIKVRGSAVQRQAKGRAYFDATISPERLQALVRMKGVIVDGLTRFAPFSANLSPQSRMSGRVQLIKERNNPKWYLSLATVAEKIDLAHPRLASTEVRDLRGGLEGMVIIDPLERSLATDDLIIRLGQAPLHLVRTTLRDPEGGKFFLDTTLEARRVPLQDLLDGLPEQLIPVIHGSRVEGVLECRAHLLVDLENIGRSNFEMSGDAPGFHALSVPPRCDVRRLVDPSYKHLARRYGLLQKTIVLGPENPDFVPYASIGSYLKNAVLICEDGSFFHHHGFLINHINDSLRMNLREKRFARGASTITMQLVKNLFLSEEKTFSRKLQEVMLTWWIEHEMPKERMFEIYMSVIELGPRIYGCGPASQYFFHCHPSQLSPVQAAWLASIISNPERHPHPSYGAMVALIIDRMAGRGLISPEDLVKIQETYFPGAAAEGEGATLPGDAGEGAALPDDVGAGNGGEPGASAAPKPAGETAPPPAPSPIPPAP
jgi:hypothetical protein